MPDSHSLFKSYLIVTSNKTACESTRETYFVWTLRSGFVWGALSLCYGGHRKRLISARIFHLFIYSFLSLLFLLSKLPCIFGIRFLCVCLLCVWTKEKKIDRQSNTNEMIDMYTSIQTTERYRETKISSNKQTNKQIHN